MKKLLFCLVVAGICLPLSTPRSQAAPNNCQLVCCSVGGPTTPCKNNLGVWTTCGAWGRPCP